MTAFQHGRKMTTLFATVLALTGAASTALAQSFTATNVYGQANYTSNATGDTSSTLNDPQDVRVDSSGDVYVADYNNNRLLYYASGSTTASRVYGQGGSFTSNTVNKGGVSSNSLASPTCVTLDGSGGIYICDQGNNRILHYPSGSTTADKVWGQGSAGNSFGTNTGGTSATALSGPVGMGLDTIGGIYIADSFNNRVLHFPSGSYTADKVYGQGSAGNSFTLATAATTSTGMNYPDDVATDSAGGMYIDDFDNNRVLYFAASGGVPGLTATLVYGQGGSFTTSATGVSSTALSGPTSARLDNNGGLFVADYGNNRVLHFPSGSTTADGVWGQGAAGNSFTTATSGTSATAFNGADVATVDTNGNLYVTDQNNNRVLFFAGASNAIALDAGVSPQTADVGATFSNQLGVTVTLNSNPVSGVGVTFTAPATSASGTFGNSTDTITINTNGSGIAQAGFFTANGTAGSYNVVVSANNAASQNIALTNQLIPQTITFPAISSQTNGTTFAPTVAASSGLTVTLTSQTLTKCTVSGPNVTLVGTGTCTLQATQAGDSTYAASSNSPTQSFTVTPALIAPTVTFTGAPASAGYQAGFTVASTTNASTTAVITSSGACSNVGTSVTMTSGTGTCTLTATWAADGTYSGTTRMQTITATKIAPTVTFTGAPASAAYQAGFTVASTTNASVTAVITSGGACSNTGTSVTMTSGTGTCTLTATWAADNNYSGTTLGQSTTAGKIAPTVTFTGAPASAAYQAGFTVASTTNASTTAVITSGGSCSNTGTSVTMTSGTGTCTLTATWAADNNYNGTTLGQTTTASKASPTVTFTGAPVSAAYQAGFTVASTTNASTTAVITSGGACSNTGTAVTMTSGTGTCSLTATWAADGNYNGTTLGQTTTASKIAPTVTFTGAPASAAYQAGFTVASTTNASTTAVITSGGACSNTGTAVTMTSGTGTCALTATWAADNNYNGTTLGQSTAASKIASTVTFTGAPASAAYQAGFTVASTTNASVTAVIASSGACSNTGTSVTMTSGTGTCTLTATWAADNNYSGTTLGQSTTAGKIAPTVTFTAAPASAAFGAGFTVASTTNASTTAVITSGGSCSNIGTSVTMTSGAGTCTLTATWAADNNYNGTSLGQTTTASKASPTVTFTGAPASAAYQAGFTVASSTNASTTAVVTSGGVCSNVGTSITMTSGTGTCALTATWAADSNYAAATLTQSTAATKLASAITFGVLPTHTYGDSPVTISATANSGLTVVFTQSGGPCSVTGTVVAITGAGACVVAANQSGNANYAAAAPASQTMTINQAPLTVMATSLVSQTGSVLPTLTATISGYVNGDNSAVVSGAPVLSTTASSTSVPGNYPITVTLGTLTAANYSFTFVNGTLTVTPVPVGLTASPFELSLQYVQGTLPSQFTETLTVASGGRSRAQFTATSSAPWLVVPATGTSGTPVTVTVNPAGLAVGTYFATITFSDGSGSAQVAVDLFVTPPPTLSSAPATLNSGGTYGTTVNTTFTVQLSSTVSGLPFTLSSSASWLTATATTGIAPDTLTVSASPVGLPAATYYGSVTVTMAGAVNSPYSIPVRYVVSGAGQNGALNSADAGTAVMAPNTILSLYGPYAGCSPLTVQVDGVPVSVTYAGATQINFVSPATVTGTSANVQVLCGGSAAEAVTIPTAPVSPAIFTATGTGTGQGSIVNADGSVNSATNPAVRGTYISVYGTGFGAYNPVSPDGLQRLAGTVTATIGGVGVNVLFAGQAPGETSGLQQINLQLPTTLPAGTAVPITLTINGVNATQNGVTVALQ